MADATETQAAADGADGHAVADATEGHAAADGADGHAVEPFTVGLIGDPASVHLRRWSDALAERGHRVVSIELVGRHRGPAERVADFARLRRAAAGVAAEPRGVVAVHAVPNGLLASGLRRLHPIVLSAWGVDVTAERPGLWGRLRDGEQRGLFRAADAVTVTSHYLADVVRRRFGVEPTIIPFGIDLVRFRPRTGERRPGPVRIGFAKVQLLPKYGPDVLVEALGRLARTNDFEAIVAGDGGLLPGLQARVEALGIADRVRFVGRLGHDEIPGLLADLDVFAMPSRLEEWGVVAAEASAAGLPVVGTRAGGVPEIVVDGQTGLLVAPEDDAALAAALETLVRDPALRARLGAAGRRKVETEYAWQDCVDRMERVLDAAIVRRHGTGAAAG